MDCSCTASVYWSPTTRSLHLTSLWWYTARHCWRFPSPPPESLPVERISLSNISNKPISLPLHLGMTEKSLFTEVIMFELPWSDSNRHISHVLPIELHGKPKGKNLMKGWLSKFTTLGEATARNRTGTLLIRNQPLYHLSYDSISRFLNYFNHFTLMGIKTNLKENGIFTAHRARTWGVFLRTVKLRTPQGGFEPPSHFRPNG